MTKIKLGNEQEKWIDQQKHIWRMVNGNKKDAKC